MAILSGFGGNFWFLVNIDGSWLFWVFFDVFFCDSWWLLAVLSSSWCYWWFLVVHGLSCWFLKVLDCSWLLTVVLFFVVVFPGKSLEFFSGSL